MNEEPVPAAIEMTAAHLRLRWKDHDATLSASVLRGACRCADCRAMVLRGRSLAIDERVRLTDAEAVGHYGLRLVFSDGHARGIYPWSLLNALEEQAS